MTDTTAQAAPDAIVTATNKLDSALGSVGTKSAELAALVGVVVNHFNNLLASLGSEVKIGIAAAENGIGGVASLTVSTEDAWKATTTQSSEPLATPSANLAG